MVLDPLVSGRFSQGAKERALGAEKLQLEEAGRLFAAIALMSVQRSWLQALALLVAIAAAVAVTLYQFVPPAVVTANAPATEFSAERAMEDVRMIAEESHPMGSSEHEEVADYIVDRLEELGISP